ncbi:hypothetical protein [Enterococcus sp. BWR-S5]|uniref:hypothetical protein n=1 Tax=Enterococcus sp. BWR-S5 TaxID=2787714 RepID=UPI0019244B3D|nr:hypothetical protein [Enterococcus sp. BWR-S5]MBL1225403.1 hypothetical protein [Enterococcus sp. BWR-S5]
MSKLYWSETIPDRLIMHENDDRPGSSLIMDLYKDNTVSIYQDSDIQIVRDKFEVMQESVEFDVDEYIHLLEMQLTMLKEWKHEQQKACG